MDSSFIKAKLLFKLARHCKWNESHTAFDDLKKGFKGHEGKLVKEAADELIKQNFLLTKPTGYGLHISLNSRKASEIKEFIKTKLNITVG